MKTIGKFVRNHSYKSDYQKWITRHLEEMTIVFEY